MTNNLSKDSTNYEKYIDYIVQQKELGVGSRKIGQHLGLGKSTVNDLYNKYLKENNVVDDNYFPKILVIDIETSPVLANVWRLFKENVGLNQIQKDWHLLSYSAKWFNAPEDEVMYSDQRNEPDIEDDTRLLKELWNLLDEADIVISQNGIRFDTAKIKSRMIIKGFKPFSSFKQIDTLVIAKKTFGFTSNKLEYMTDKLCVKYKKLKHGKFAGFELWKECLAGNEEAWNEMELYNKHDVLSLEELYIKLAPWFDKHPNFNLYSDSSKFKCNCGCSELVPNGFAYTQVSKFQRYQCKDCGAEYRGRKNLFSKEKRDSLLTNVVN